MRLLKKEEFLEQKIYVQRRGQKKNVPEKENCDGASYLVKVRVIVVSCWNKGGGEAEYN